MQSGNKSWKEFDEAVAKSANSTSKFTNFAKSAGNALKSFGSMAVNMIAVWAISEAIGLAIQGITNLIKADEIAIEKGEEAQSAITETYEKYANKVSTVSELGKKFADNTEAIETTSDAVASLTKRYAELKEGVDYDNTNESLSSAEYEEYLSISNQLAETFPSLVSGADSAGNSILNIGTNASVATEEIERLLEAEMTLAHMDILENANESFKGYHTQSKEITEEISSLEEQKSRLQQASSGITMSSEEIRDALSKGSIKFEDISAEDGARIVKVLDQYKGEWGKVKESIKTINGQTLESAVYSIEPITDEAMLDEATKAIEEQISHSSDMVNAQLGEVESQIMAKKVEQEQVWQAFAASTVQPYLATATQLMDVPAELTDAVQNNLPNIDWSKMYTDYDGNVDSMLLNEFVVPLKNMEPAAQEAIISAFSLNPAEMSIAEYEEAVNNALTNAFDDENTRQEWKDKFGFDSLVKDAKDQADALKNEFKYASEDVIDSLSGEDRELAYQIAIEDEEFNGTWADVKEKIQELKSMTEGTVTFSYSGFIVDVSDAVAQMDKINAALASSVSGKGLNVSYDLDEETGVATLTGDIADLMSAYSDLEGYDAESLFLKTANGVQVNKKALRALQAQEEAINKDNWMEKRKALVEDLTDATEELKVAQTSGDDTAIASAQATVDSLNQQLHTVDLLTAAYDGATSAYQKWLDAQSNGEVGDMYRNVSETMKERGAELYKEGRYNTDEFRAIAQYWSDEDLSTASMEKVVKAYEKAATARKRYFTGDKQGIDNFMYDMMNDAELISEGVVTILEDGFKFDAGADEVLAKRFNVSVEAIQSLLNAASEYNENIIVGDTSGAKDYEASLEAIKTKAQEAQEACKKINEEMSGGTGADWSSIMDFDTATMSADELQSKIKEISNARAELPVDSEAYQQTQEVIDGCQAKVDELNGTTGILNFEVSGNEELDTVEEAEAKLKELEDYKATLDVDSSRFDEVSEKINELEEHLKDLEEEPVSPTVTLDQMQSVADSVQEAKSRIDSINGYNATATVKIDAMNDEVLIEVANTLASLPKEVQTQIGIDEGNLSNVQGILSQLVNSPETINVPINANATTTGQGEVDSLKSSVDKLSDKNIDVKALVTGKSAVVGLKSAIDSLKNKSITVTTTRKTVYETEGGPGGLLGTATAKGASFAQGSTGGLYPIPKLSGRALAMGTLQDTSWLRPHWKTHNSEVALTGEVGQELVVKGNRWWTVGDNGAEFASIPQGSIIFNAQQTKELLSKGKINGRGQAHLNGTAYSIGSNWVFGNTGSGNLKGTGYKNVTKKSNATTTKTATSTASKAADELFDFVEILRERTKETTEKLTDSIEDMVGLASKMSANASALTQVQKEIQVNQNAYNKYLSQAKAVGLSDTYAKQIREGSLNITNITDENLKEKIEDYQKWYDLAVDCKNTIRDLQKDEKELALDRLTYIEDYYDAVISLNEAYQEANDARLEFNDAIGSSAISGDVRQIVENSLKRQQDSYDQALQQLIDYQNETNSLIENGYLEIDSIEYYEAQAQIQEFTAAVDEAATAVIELQDKILEIDYTRLQQLIDGSDRRTEQLKNAQSLAESRNELISRDVLQEQVDSLSASLMTSYELRDKKLKEQNLYDVGSTRYQELAEEIAELDGEIFSNLEEIETIKDQIFENEFFNYEKEQANLEYFIGELEDFASLINDDALFDKAGRLTESGYAKLSLIGQQMATSKQQIADATEALNKLDEMLANGLITQTEYDDKSKELLDTIRDSAIATNDYKQEILDLYLTQADKENEALKENISLRQQALQNEKAYWDYAESLKSKTKSVNELEARIAALKGTNNTAALAELKRLQAQLEEAQSDLDNTKRDHAYDLMDEGYGLMSDNLDSNLEDLEYSITHSTEKQLSVVQSMLSQMVGSYQEAFGKINSIITETGFVGSTNFNNTASNISTSTGAGSIASGATQTQSTVQAGSAATNINSNNIANGDHGTIETEINKEANTDNRLCAELKISRSSLSLQEGDSETISVSIRPNDAKNKTISWTSSNPNVVAVSADGKVTGVAPGSAIVTASTTDGSGLRQTCKVTITKKPDPPKPPVTTNTSTNQANNGVVDVGDKVTFVSGVYHEDSYGRGRWGSYNLGKQVYITSLNPGSPYPIHISRGNGLGRNDLGWLKQNQIKGYSGGSKYINRRQWALIDDTPTGKADPGSEVVFTGAGTLLELDRGSMVFNKSQKEFLFDISKNKELPMPEFRVPTVSEISSGLPTVVGNDMSHNAEINLHFDSMLTIEGSVTKEAIPGFQKELRNNISYISDQLGIHLRRELRKL